MTGAERWRSRQAPAQPSGDSSRGGRFGEAAAIGPRGKGKGQLRALGGGGGRQAGGKKKVREAEPSEADTKDEHRGTQRVPRGARAPCLPRWICEALTLREDGGRYRKRTADGVHAAHAARLVACDESLLLVWDRS